MDRASKREMFQTETMAFKFTKGRRYGAIR